MRIGEKLNDRYRVIQSLGRGGMAQVTLVEDLNLKRNVAMKTIRVDKSSRATFKQRFRREAQTCSLVKHPNVIPVYDFGTLEDGAFFYTMEYLPYPTLGDIIDRFGQLSEERAVSFARQLAEALAACHAKGIVHRDVKTSNLIIKDDDTLLLADFGLVADLDNTRITQTGDFVGTPLYLPPEALTNREVDSRSDIYQLGLVFHELLTGHSLIEGEMSLSGLLSRIAKPDFQPNSLIRSDVPQKWRSLLQRCLTRNLDDRLPSARDFINVIDGVLTLTRPKSKAALGNSPTLFSWNTAIPLFVIGLVLVLALFVLSTGTNQWDVDNLAIFPLEKSAVITWSSKIPYKSQLHVDGKDYRYTTAASAETTCIHRVQVWGLIPQSKYNIKVVFPNGTSSLTTTFVTKNSNNSSEGVEFFTKAIKAFIEDQSEQAGKKLRTLVKKEAANEIIKVIGAFLPICNCSAKHEMSELTKLQFAQCDERYLTLLPIVLDLLEQSGSGVVKREDLIVFTINSIRFFDDYRHCEDKWRHHYKEEESFKFTNLGVAGRPYYFKLINATEKRLQKWTEKNGSLPPSLRLLHAFLLTYSLLPGKGVEQTKILRQILFGEKKRTASKDALIALSLFIEVNAFSKGKDAKRFAAFDKVCFAATEKFTTNWSDDSYGVVLRALTETHIEIIERCLLARDLYDFEDIIKKCNAVIKHYRNSPLIMRFRKRLVTLKKLKEDERRRIIRQIDRYLWSGK